MLVATRILTNTPLWVFAIIGHAVSGASAGYFSGRAVTLLRRYRNFDTGENSGARAADGG